MFCSKCGHRISPNEKFCGNCGAIAEVKKENEQVKDNKPKYQVIDPKKPTFDSEVEKKIETKIDNKPVDKKIDVKSINSKEPKEFKKVVVPSNRVNQIENKDIKAPLKTENKFTAVPQKPVDVKVKEENKFEARKENIVGTKPQSIEIKHEVKDKAVSTIEKNTLQPRVDEKEESKKIVIKAPVKEEKSKKIVIPMSKINSLNESQMAKKKEPENKIENKTIIVPLREEDRVIKPPTSDFTLGVQKDLEKTSTIRVEPPKKENNLQDLMVPPIANVHKPENVTTNVATPNTLKVDTPKEEHRPRKKKGGVLKYAFVVLLIMLITGGITYTLMTYQHNKELALQKKSAVDTVYSNGFTYKVPQSLEYKVNNEGLVVSNKEDTWAMSITAKKVQYQSLKADPQAIKTNYENSGCTASKQKNVTLKNREFMTFEVTCNNENTLVVYTKANEEFTYGVDIRNSDNSFDDSQLSTLATILNQSEYTEEKYLEVEDVSVNGIGLTSFLNTEVPEPTE